MHFEKTNLPWVPARLRLAEWNHTIVGGYADMFGTILCAVRKCRYPTSIVALSIKCATLSSLLWLVMDRLIGVGSESRIQTSNARENVLIDTVPIVWLLRACMQRNHLHDVSSL